jgi:hypothetical protein
MMPCIVVITLRSYKSPNGHTRGTLGARVRVGGRRVLKKKKGEPRPALSPISNYYFLFVFECEFELPLPVFVIESFGATLS